MEELPTTKDILGQIDEAFAEMGQNPDEHTEAALDLMHAEDDNTDDEPLQPAHSESAAD